RQALVGRPDQEDHAELEALRLVDAEDVHLLARRLEVRSDRIVPRLAQELEVRDEERRAVGRQRATGALDEAQELRDVSRLLLDERGVRVEIPREELRPFEELEEERGRSELGRARGVMPEVIDEAFRRSDRIVAGDLLDVLDVHLVGCLPAAQPLVDAESRLEPLGILRDEPVRGVQQALRRTTILDERHRGVVGIAFAEAVEVPERATAPSEDRLIVVADDGDVAMWLGEEPEELELRVVRVLELVDEDVAKPTPEPGCRRRVIAEQLQRERDLVAEIDDAVT